MSENTEFKEILNDDDEHKWLTTQPERKIYRKGITLRDEIMFSELVKGDKFEVFDDNVQVEYEDGKKQFIATSDPYYWNGILTIEIE